MSELPRFNMFPPPRRWSVQTTLSPRIRASCWSPSAGVSSRFWLVVVSWMTIWVCLPSTSNMWGAWVQTIREPDMRVCQTPPFRFERFVKLPSENRWKKASGPCGSVSDIWSTIPVEP
jgi:hypothetical protein